MFRARIARWSALIVTLAVLGVVIFVVLATGRANDKQRDFTGPLNPEGYAPIERCATIKLEDPVAAARANIAKNDLRPFTATGFVFFDVPGVFCPTNGYAMQSRGGSYSSDVPDVCDGQWSHSNAPADAMVAYNRELAKNARFQEITGCRPSTYCEERYAKHGFAQEPDPKCPGEPAILRGVATRGTVQQLARVLEGFPDRSPETLDLLTTALADALRSARWDNAELLLDNGADVNGKARGETQDGSGWLRSPLYDVFNQTEDRGATLPRAKWLIGKGANLQNPKAQDILSLPAITGDLERAKFLLDFGASPNGSIDPEWLDRMAAADMAVAGGRGGTPFYTALQYARQRYARRTPEELRIANEKLNTARQIAVLYYQAGGRFKAGSLYDELRREPDYKVASIVFAAAHREGRLADLFERLLYPNGRDRPSVISDTRPEERRFLAYVRALKLCETIEPVPMNDWISLCPEYEGQWIE